MPNDAIEQRCQTCIEHGRPYDGPCPHCGAPAKAYAITAALTPHVPDEGLSERYRDIRTSIQRQLPDAHSDRVILSGADWDIVLHALAQPKAGAVDREQIMRVWLPILDPRFSQRRISQALDETLKIVGVL